jgi:hypothetical protein
MPPLAKDDPLCQWALETWRWLHEHFHEAARAFRGDYAGTDFERAFLTETAAVGRAAYRGRLVTLLEDLVAALAGGGSPEERLSVALADAMRLRTLLGVWDSPTYWNDEGDGKWDDRPFTEHPLYKWADATYRLLLTDFNDYADEFFGEPNGLGPGGFALAYSMETKPPNGNRLDYLERRIEILKQVVRATRVTVAAQAEAADDLAMWLPDWLGHRIEELRSLQADIGQLLVDPAMNNAKLKRCEQVRATLGQIDAEVTRRLQRDGREWVDYFNEDPDWYEPHVVRIGQDEPREVMRLLAYKADQLAHIRKQVK